LENRIVHFTGQLNLQSNIRLPHSRYTKKYQLKVSYFKWFFKCSDCIGFN
jgi:hypothetical protein